MIISWWIFQQPIEQCKQKVFWDLTRQKWMNYIQWVWLWLWWITSRQMCLKMKLQKNFSILKIVAKIICYCENMICIWPRCKGHLVNWFIVFSWCYIVFCTYTSSNETKHKTVTAWQLSSVLYQSYKSHRMIGLDWESNLRTIILS